MSRKRARKKTISFKKVAISIVFMLVIFAIQYFEIYVLVDIMRKNNQSGVATGNEQHENGASDIQSSYNILDIPEYQDSPYVIINDNKPFFTEADYTTEAFEEYSELDVLGRCGIAYANICKEIMPTESEERTDISSVRPSGWNQKAYKGLVEGDYIYNRCHLIGWQLAGENDNELNLITGTRYMNVQGMLPFENLVDDYFEIKANENNHVLYRVTPIYEGNNLVASGVQIEAYSVEDDGAGICFNVYLYNVQPGITINYATGENYLSSWE